MLKQQQLKGPPIVHCHRDRSNSENLTAGRNTFSANGLKSGNNPPLNLNKENVKKKTLIFGDSIVKHIDGWRLNKRMRSIVSVR